MPTYHRCGDVSRKTGRDGAAYLDDLIGVAPPESASTVYDDLGVLLSDLGLVENHMKAAPPATSQLVLGILIDTVDMTLSVGPDRLQDTIVLLQVWLKKSRCTKVELQSLLGTLCFIMKCVRQSRVFLNRLLTVLRSFSPSTKWMELTEDFCKDVRWWVHFMPKFNGVSLIPPDTWTAPDEVFTTDSTLSGCGG